MTCIHCKGKIVNKMIRKDCVVICETCTQRLVSTQSRNLDEETLENRVLRLSEARKKRKVTRTIRELKPIGRENV